MFSSRRYIKCPIFCYVGGLFERVTLPSGEVEERSFIGGVAIRTLTKKTNNEQKLATRYLHKDHIGSASSVLAASDILKASYTVDEACQKREQ